MKKPQFPLKENIAEAEKSKLEKIADRAATLKALKKRRFSAGVGLVNRLTNNSVDARIAKLKGRLKEDRQELKKQAEELKDKEDWSLKEEVQADHVQKLNRKIRHLVSDGEGDDEIHDEIDEQLR